MLHFCYMAHLYTHQYQHTWIQKRLLSIHNQLNIHNRALLVKYTFDFREDNSNLGTVPENTLGHYQKSLVCRSNCSYHQSYSIRRLYGSSQRYIRRYQRRFGENHVQSPLGNDNQMLSVICTVRSSNTCLLYRTLWYSEFHFLRNQDHKRSYKFHQGSYMLHSHGSCWYSDTHQSLHKNFRLVLKPGFCMTIRFCCHCLFL